MICNVCGMEIKPGETGVFGLAHMHEWQCIAALKVALKESARLTRNNDGNYSIDDAISDLWEVQFTDNTAAEASEARSEIEDIMWRLSERQ